MFGSQGFPGPVPSPTTQLRAIGATIRKARRDRDLSQEALAGLAGINPKHLSEIERANKDPRVTTVLALVHGMGMTFEAFAEMYDVRFSEDA